MHQNMAKMSPKIGDIRRQFTLDKYQEFLRPALHNGVEKPDAVMYAVRGMLTKGVKIMGKTNADIEDWDVENEEFWEREGKRIASRNLWISIPSLLTGFAVWLMWGMITTQMKNLGFPFSCLPSLR